MNAHKNKLADLTIAPFSQWAVADEMQILSAQPLRSLRLGGEGYFPDLR